MSSLLSKEDAIWKQREKVNWLKDGDTNSKKKKIMLWVVDAEREIIL